MKFLSFIRTIVTIAAIVMFGALFTPASAATTYVISNWQNPTPFSFFSFTSPVHLTGTYTLPPDWVGTIYVWQDGVQLPQQLTVSNMGGATAKTAAFDINLGIQPAIPSPHSISIEFFGGVSCLFATPSTCAPTLTNHVDENVVPRTYTAADSPDPVLALSYDASGTQPVASPAFDFANVVVGTPDTRILYIRNIGGGIAKGTVSISGGANPFYCIGVCTYSIPAGVALPMQIQYAPSNAGVNTGALSIACTTINCLSINTTLSGSAIAAAVPPMISLSRSSLSYGTVNVGTLSDKTITIKNTGGGTLTGTITIGDTVNYSCVPNCDYAIPAGSSYTITVRFLPTVGGALNTTLSFSGAVAPKSINVTGSGNMLPLIDINCVGCGNVGSGSQYHWDLPNPVAPGQTFTQTVEVRNIGYGTMVSGQIDPGIWNTLGWHCVSVTQQDGTVNSYANDAPCQITNLNAGSGALPAVVTMQFTGTTTQTGPLTSTAHFTNFTNAGDGKNLQLTANVTLLAILQITNNTYNNYPANNVGFPNTFINVPITQVLTLTNLGTATITNALVNLPIGVGVFTCPSTDCNLPLTIDPGKGVNITFTFNPTLPTYYNQPFTICLSPTCEAYTMDGWGADPQITALSQIGGGENMDLYIYCAKEGSICNFPGTTTTVYFGSDGSSVSKTFTDSASCDTTTFGSDPKPGFRKACWYANPEHGTWINKPWTTTNRFLIYNSGMGGAIYWRIVNTTSFVCDDIHPTSSNYCQGDVANNDGSDYTSRDDINYPFFFFNPTVANTPINETLTIQYYRVADRWNPVPDCNYCHTVTFNMSGTGIAGTHLTYSMDSFPTTNLNATSTANLTITNDGTDPNTQVTLTYLDGMFSCTANCGPYIIQPNSSEVAEITFLPTSVGVQNGHFNLAAIGAQTAPNITVPVTGIGNSSPIIELLPGTGFIDYGTVNEGTMMLSGTGTVAPIIVKNVGAGPLTGDATIVDGTNYKCISCHYEALAPLDQIELSIGFSPLSVSPPSLNDVVNFSGASGVTKLDLYGQGALGASSITSVDADFGRVLIRAGSFKEQVVTIYNLGGIDVPGGDITLTGPFTCSHPPTPFNTVTNLCSYPIIPAGGSVTFTIRFKPVAPGIASGMLTLGSSSNARVRLSGTGVVPSVKFKEK